MLRANSLQQDSGRLIGEFFYFISTLESCKHIIFAHYKNSPMCFTLPLSEVTQTQQNPWPYVYPYPEDIGIYHMIIEAVRNNRGDG